METNEKLTKGIGTKEPETLKPARVTVKDVKIEPVKFAKDDGEKVILVCKHPDREETLNISKAQVMRKDTRKIIGLWYNEDADGLILKNSALADVLRFANVNQTQDLVGKEFDTVEDANGYLCLKAYN